jgi:signal transduction histidine kinase
MTMTLTLRQRILVTLAPLLALLALLGGAGVVLLYRLGGSIDVILRENYDSVLYMERLGEALERIDSTFQFTLADREDPKHEEYEANWVRFGDNLRLEQSNITLPGEAELASRLAQVAKRYRAEGDAFNALPSGDPRRPRNYFEAEGLLERFRELKEVSGSIHRLNQENMELASARARQTADDSLVGFAGGLALTALLAGLLAWKTTAGILRPIQAVTRSALSIGAGDLDQVVPVTSGDEVGQLANAFNTMARQLRGFRQSDTARLLRAQRTTQATIDSFPDPVLVVDPEGRAEMANPAAQRLFGITGWHGGQGAALPWQPPEGLQEPLRRAVREQSAYLPEGFDKVVPLRVDGQERSFLPRLLPIREAEGKTLGAAVLLEDVTRFRLLDQIKNDLVATASHELKTPLTSVRLALHLLLEEAVGPLTSKQAELLLDARENAERLLAMVNNLLDLARLEQGRHRLELRATPPTDLLHAAAEAARPRAQDKGLTLAFPAALEDLPPVAADPNRFGHALGNLLDNAIRYTKEGGRISLTAQHMGDEVEIAISDTGPGIAPEYLPHVFERFFRIPGQNEGTGSGLGLAIVREIVQAHGGTVVCESQLGVGTVFRVRLPTWSALPGQRSGAPAIAPPGAN